MRPVRINLTEITEDKFLYMMLKYFPSVEESHVDWIKQFYMEMSERYFQVILDLDSGEVIQAFLPDGTWALSKFYIDLVPTPDKLDENGFEKIDDMKYLDKEFNNINKLNKPKKKEIVIDEKKIDKILDKISKNGRESLSIQEEQILKLYAKKK